MYKKYITAFTSCTIVLSIVFLLTVGSVFAQEASNIEAFQDGPRQKEEYTTELLSGDAVVGDFVVGPGKVDLVLSPGESKTIEMVVTNRMGEPKTFSFEIEDAEGSYDSEQAVVLLGDDRGQYTLKDYIQIPKMEFELQHMERARIPVTVSLPADAEPGGHYGSVLVSTVSRDADLAQDRGASPSSAIISRIGTLFFVVTPGSADIAGSLKSFKTMPDKPIFFQGPIDFGLVYENTGSVHVNPYGEIRITNMLGSDVGFIELDPWFALPKSLRTREISWERELLIGRYTATAFINRGYQDIVDEVQVTFWVIPWKLVGLAFGAFFIFFLSVRFIVTRFEFKRK